MASPNYMKSKGLNFLLLITSLFGYLEWGGNHHLSLFQAEGEILLKLATTPASVLHPFTLFPLMGQVLLLISLVQKKPNKLLTYLSIGSLGILLAFMFLIGLIELNAKIILSTLPFLSVAVLTIIHTRKT